MEQEQAITQTIKYNSLGDSLWIRRYNGPGNSNDEAISIAIDALNNICVTGYSIGNGTGNDYATLKYNPSGSLLWTRRYNGPGNGIDQAKSIAVDGSGNISVSGLSAGIGTGTSDYATIKYNSLGDTLWVRRYNGSANGIDQANSLDFDPSGNVFVTGYSAGTGTGSSDYATIKYNSNGDSLWVRRYNGPANNVDQANSMMADDSGNVYVTGYSVGSGTGNDFATIKYNSAGVQQWAQRYNNGDDQSKYIIFDSLNNVYVTGFSSNDFLTIKYNSAGVQQWFHRYENNNAYSSCVVIDRFRNLYVSGSRYTTSGITWNYLTVKYSQQLIVKSLIEGFYDPVSNKMVRDTARAYLRNVSPPYSIVDSAKYYLDSAGTGYYRLHNAIYDQYYIVIKHRNSIETWSNTTFPFQTMTYDFTTSANKAFGNNQVLKGSKYCIYSGDINQDGIIDVVDLGMADNDAFNSTGGYVQSDVNGDFFVDLSDLAIVDNNAFNFVSVVRP